jgi:hypothetical protein
MYTLFPFTGHKKNTDGSTVGYMILLAGVCYGDSQVAKHILCPHFFLKIVFIITSLST